MFRLPGKCKFFLGLFDPSCNSEAPSRFQTFESLLEGMRCGIERIMSPAFTRQFERHEESKMHPYGAETPSRLYECTRIVLLAVRIHASINLISGLEKCNPADSRSVLLMCEAGSCLDS
ncbi:hypothetical protein VPH35_086710 [Triticum aestivum]